MMIAYDNIGLAKGLVVINLGINPASQLPSRVA